jgi:hypothetical protein
MSVAFRRDGDEEHLEPKFELPIPPGPNLVTARGKAMIDEKCAEYEAAIAAGAMRRKSNPPAAICAIGAHACGDGSGNARARWFLRRLWRDGSVRLKGKERTITIVGDDEADPAAGLLSFSAPLSRAMMEAEPGECVDFGGVAEAIEIMAIEIC